MSIMWLYHPICSWLFLKGNKSLSFPCSSYSRFTSLLVFIRHTRLLATCIACSLCLELFSRSVVSDSLDSATPWTAVHQLPYPLLSLRVCSNSCPLSQRCLKCFLPDPYMYCIIISFTLLFKCEAFPGSFCLKQLLLPFISSPDCLIFLMVHYGTINLLFNFVQPKGWDYLTYYLISSCQNIAWDVEECSRLVISKYLLSEWMNE